ncbi:MAG TPA: hypothetical protein VGS60_01165 [Actinomycetes bacterium]|jgi:hypothetical protein|nr:hypothetical protein [Actinomycetes bacterium]
MVMSPAARRLALTTHVVSSVDWLGAVLTFIGRSELPSLVASERPCNP